MLGIGDIFLYCVFTCFVLQIAGEACPPKIGPLRRVGKTQYYIAHDNPRGNFVDHDEARALCEANGLAMARVKDMQTMAVLGRSLEDLVEKERLLDTWYWLDAVFNDTTERYYWGIDGKGGEVKFSTFLYRKYRPTGLASFVNYKGHYLIDSTVKQCLAFALPWPGKGDPNRKGVVYGHQTILDERPCESIQTRHAMCQSNKTDCERGPPDPFVLAANQGTIDYFEIGNWILGDRKYIVNWKHRTLQQTEKYCNGLGLELVDPGIVSAALIPQLKMWSRNITVSQFWTSLKFDPKHRKFTSKTGEEVGSNKVKVEFTDHVISARSNKHSREFCVALSLSYEFKNQMACEDPSSSTCSWSFIDYIPANCNNYLATICQHPDQKNRDDVQWEKSYFSRKHGINKALEDTALTKEFGYDGNAAVLRSKYKQTFGSLLCPEGYQMVREQHKGWSFKPSNKEVYIYDYKETYWVVDEQNFNKKADSDCTISYPDPPDGDGHIRSTRKVKCTEWHFYLCEKIKRPVKKKSWNSPSPPTMEWNDKRQPRIYPLVKS